MDSLEKDNILEAAYVKFDANGFIEVFESQNKVSIMIFDSHKDSLRKRIYDVVKSNPPTYRTHGKYQGYDFIHVFTETIRKLESNKRYRSLTLKEEV